MRIHHSEMADVLRGRHNCNAFVGRPPLECQCNFSMKIPAQFDRYAQSYDDVLQNALSISGENKNYFASGRIRWLKKSLEQISYQPLSVLDFGCGTGSSVSILRDICGIDRVVGVDISPKSIEVAANSYANNKVQFFTYGYYPPGS